jgi:GT2 family glycosyltransferase/peptidoglycan/xylan/chitin deacetylase (PgdA/CDA1 family)
MAAEPEARPRFSVVVPTFQRRDLVVENVHALCRQEGAPPFEAVVVVDGSTDGTAAALHALELPFPLAVVEQSNQGRSAACNHGAEAATGELLLFLDDDMEPDPGLLAAHQRAHANGARVVIGHIPLHPDSPPGFLSDSVRAWAEERYRVLSEPGRRIGLDEFLTGQMSIGREDFLGLGGFDLGFTRGGTFGCEDFDLGWRLQRAGYEIVFAPDAISAQRYVVTPRQHLRQWRQNGAAKVMLARKHPEEAPFIFRRRARRADRYVWRWLRWPRRELVLALLGAGVENRLTVRSFRRIRDLEFDAGVRSAGGPPQRRPIRIVCYHAVADLEGAGPLEPYGIPPDRFRRQLQWLSRRYRFIDAAEMRSYVHGHGVPRRAVLLTFDDCSTDLLDVALPLLKEMDAPAIAFPVTGLLGRTNEWDRAITDRQLALLDADGLARLAQSGIAIGVHTRTHRMLDRLEPAEVREEIEESMADLRRAGLEAPSFLAYPHGAFDDGVQAVAREAGLDGAFTTRPGLARPETDPFALPRIEIFRRDGRVRFAWKLLTGRRAGRPGS